MKLRNSIRPIRLLLLLSGLLALASCRQNETQSLSEYLDYVIENKHIFEAEKEERISRLRNLLGVSNLTPEQEYEINTKLYEEFRKYKLDSAIRYVERNLEIARQLDNKRLTYLSNMYLAQLYSFSGMCVEANQILRSIRSSELPCDLLPVYYEANNRYFQHYATLSSQRSHLHEMNIYRDSLMMVSDPGSFRYRIHLSYKLMGNGKMDEARAILDELLEEVGKDTPLYAETAYAYGCFYRLNKDPEAEKKYFMLSAIADAKSAVKENASFHTLALMYYDQGDLSRAFKYTQAAIEDAVFSNVQFRTTQMSKFYSIINSIYQAKEAKSKSKLQHYLILISVLSLFLVLLFIYVYQQIHKLYRIKEELSRTNGRLMQLNDELHEKNTQLTDSNIIKEQYIARFFDLCSMYIDKLEDYRKSLNKLAQNRQIDELYKQLKSTSMMENELDELYKNFDAIFLNLYPSFVADFNALLVEDERIVLKSEDLLNKELRIYALLRLGITDSVKIASFLRCSLSTVYNYRTKPGTRPQYRVRTSKKWSCGSVCRPKTGLERFHGNYIFFVYFFDKIFIYKHIILYRFYNFRPNL